MLDDIKFQDIMKRIYEASESKTQQQLATVLGVQQSSISDAQKRKSIPDSWLISLLTSHNINPLWLLEGALPKYQINVENTCLPLSSENTSKAYFQEFNSNRSASSYRVPVYSFFYNGLLDDNNNKLFDIEDYFYLSKNHYKDNGLIFQIDNKSMEPCILQNSLIFVNCADTKLVSGEIYLFCIPIQGLYAARIFHSSQVNENFESMINLVPDNKIFPSLNLSINQANEYAIGRIYSVYNTF